VLLPFSGDFLFKGERFIERKVCIRTPSATLYCPLLFGKHRFLSIKRC